MNWGCGLNRGLVTWYLGLPQFGGGKSWRDLARANPGILTNMDPPASWGPSSRQGGWLCASFDGVDDYVNCGDKPIFEFAGDFSVLCRFRSDTGTDQAMVSKWTGLGSGSQWWIGRYYGKVQAGIYAVDTTMVVLDSGAAYKDGKWHHVALVRSGSTGYLYVDSILKANKTVGVKPAGQNAAPLMLGDNDQAIWPYQGQLDDVRIFDRALTGTEITQLERDWLAYGHKTLNRLRRWLPVTPVPLGAEPPYHTAAGRARLTGATAGGLYLTGGQAGQTQTCGPLAGQIHG